jgi:hypothetical protein
MENINDNPIIEEVVEETPIVEEAHVAEAPVVEETPAEPVVEEQPVQDAITAPAYSNNNKEVPALGAVNNGVMGTTSVPRPEPRSYNKPNPSDSVEKLAIYSSKNVSWQGVGTVHRGYNIVAKDIADQWLTRTHVRVATPEEVKKAFG